MCNVSHLRLESVTTVRGVKQVLVNTLNSGLTGGAMYPKARITQDILRLSCLHIILFISLTLIRGCYHTGVEKIRSADF